MPKRVSDRVARWQKDTGWVGITFIGGVDEDGGINFQMYVLPVLVVHVFTVI